MRKPSARQIRLNNEAIEKLRLEELQAALSLGNAIEFEAAIDTLPQVSIYAAQEVAYQMVDALQSAVDKYEAQMKVELAQRLMRVIEIHQHEVTKRLEQFNDFNKGQKKLFDFSLTETLPSKVVTRVVCDAYCVADFLGHAGAEVKQTYKNLMKASITTLEAARVARNA